MSKALINDYNWDDNETVHAYALFSAIHDRYLAANRTLIKKASIASASRILDLAAGMGATTQCLLPEIGPDARVACVEPSKSMRSEGQSRVRDARVKWLAELPNADNTCPGDDNYDRIVCGAAIWQLLPLHTTIEQLGRLLKPGGALCFNIPGQYLGEADQPGGGEDPNLLELPALLMQLIKDRGIESIPHPATNTLPLDHLSIKRIDSILRSNGFIPVRWRFNHRLSQAAYRDWFKIPVISNGIFRGLKNAIRNQLIDEAYQQLDTQSWRWECWYGWTAWKPDS